MLQSNEQFAVVVSIFLSGDALTGHVEISPIGNWKISEARTLGYSSVILANALAKAVNEAVEGIGPFPWSVEDDQWLAKCLGKG